MVTLGISTNTRLLGLAIINQEKLEDYFIHLHKSPWSASKADKIIKGLEPCVRQYCIKRVVLSIPYVHHQTKEFKYLISHIQKYFTTKEIPVFTKTIQESYSVYAPEHKKTKKKFMSALCSKYPELTYCYNRELRNRSKYYIKVFEAVAAATLQEQEN